MSFSLPTLSSVLFIPMDTIWLESIQGRFAVQCTGLPTGIGRKAKSSS
jgi:hypothetical protein